METKKVKITRRDMLKMAGMGLGGALVAACTPPATPPPPQVVEVTKVVEKVSTQVVEKVVQVQVTPTPKPIKIFKVTYWEHSPWTTAQMAKKEDDFVYQHILKTYNLDVTLKAAPSTDADAKLNASIAAGEMPDVIEAYWGPSNTVSKALTDQGVLIPIDDYLKATPYLQTYLKPEEWVYLTFGGKKYGLAQPRPFSNWDTVWIRTDWLEKLKLKMPTTMEELAEVAKAFTTQDPDGNGKKDNFGFSGYKDASGVPFSGMQSFFAPFGVWPGRNHIYVENNKVTFSAFSDYAKNALTWWNANIKAGSVDPDWSVHTIETWRNAVAQQRPGIVTAEFQFLRDGSSNSNLGKIISQGNPNAKWEQVPALKGPYGSFVAWKGTPVDVGFWYTKQAKSEAGKIEAIMQWWNDAMNPDSETYRIMVYGLPGRQYVMDDKGRRTHRFTPPELQWHSYWLVNRRGDEGYFYYYRTEANPWFKSEEGGKLGDRQLFSISQPQILSVDPLLAAHPQFKDLQTFMREQHLKFGNGDQAFDKWSAFIDQANKTYNLEKISADYTDQLKKLGLIK
jgi:putative aldouronate transport system substrate-binding protein